MYGSSRLGMTKPGIDVTGTDAAEVNPEAMDGNIEGSYTTFERGRKFFELSNHLGNVLATVSDKRFGLDDDGNTFVDIYEADVVSVQDYYPGGMLMPGREYQSSSTSYRYGAANGQEKSTEINNDSYTAKFWQYDSRLGRRWNIDPRPNVSISVYTAYAGNPVIGIDLLGDTLGVNSSNKQSMTDLMSIVKSENQKYIGQDSYGQLTFNTKEFNKLSKHKQSIALQSDAGLDLLKNMIESKSNFWYAATNRIRYWETDLKGERIKKVEVFLDDFIKVGTKLGTDPIPGIGGIPLYTSFTNLSNTRRGDEARMGGGQLPAKEDRYNNYIRKYDGEVYIVPGSFYQTNLGITKEIPRASIVFHELLENYFRVMGSSYENAHQSAIQSEKYFKPLGNNNPGSVYYMITGELK